MLRSNHQICHAKDCVNSGSINRYLIVCSLYFKIHFHTKRFTYPVFLHYPDFFRPAFKFFNIFKQPVRIVGYFIEPLIQFFFCNFRFTPPADPVNDLFICHNRQTLWTPVSFFLFLVSKTFFVKLQKKPLSPLIVIRSASSNLTTPVITDTDFFQLLFHNFNIFISPFFRVNIIFYSRVFRRKPESVPTHRMQDVVTLHFLISGNHISYDIVFTMSHMKTAAGRVREHHKNIIFLFFREILCFKKPFTFPVSLPLLIYHITYHSWTPSLLLYFPFSFLPPRRISQRFMVIYLRFAQLPFPSSALGFFRASVPPAFFPPSDPWLLSSAFAVFTASDF